MGFTRSPVRHKSSQGVPNRRVRLHWEHDNGGSTAAPGRSRKTARIRAPRNGGQHIVGDARRNNQPYATDHRAVISRVSTLSTDLRRISASVQTPTLDNMGHLALQPMVGKWGLVLQPTTTLHSNSEREIFPKRVMTMYSPLDPQLGSQSWPRYV